MFFRCRDLERPFFFSLSEFPFLDESELFTIFRFRSSGMGETNIGKFESHFVCLQRKSLACEKMSHFHRVAQGKCMAVICSDYISRILLL